jgi:ubiquinone/menaquinone biosynthesis C-methylase UbiE
MMLKHSKTEYIPALRFNWLTRYYDVVVGLSTREQTFKRALIKQARIEAGMQVLDLASGTGTLAIWVKQNHPLATVMGVDGDPDILAIAVSKAHHAKVDVNFAQALSFSLPYRDGHFDRAFSSLFFHHLSWEGKQRTAVELFRILKPGAELHVADWGRPTNTLMRGLFLFIQLLDGFKNTQDNVSGKLIELFNQVGFQEVVERKTFSTLFGTMALYSAQKAIYDLKI